MIYIVIGAVVIFIILVVLIIYCYKADNIMIEFNKKMNNSYDQINNEMHKRADKVKSLVEYITPSITYNTELEKTVVKLKKSLDNYFTAGTREYQIKSQNEISKRIKELIDLLNTPHYNELIDKNIEELINDINKSEEKIIFSKNIYNNLVQNYNAYISKFLNKKIAKKFKYGPMEKLGE